MFTDRTLRHIFIISLIVAVISPLINLFSTDLFKNFETVLSTLLVSIASAAMLIVITLLLFKLDKNISNLKETEKALAKSEKLHRAIIENSNDMIWMLDKQGNFTFLNKQAENISGYNASDWIGKNFVPLVSVEDLPRLNNLFSECLKGKALSFEANIYSASGSTIVLLINSVPIIEGDEIIGVLNFGHDITERKKADESLRQNHELLIMEHKKLKAVFRQVEITKKEWEKTMDCVRDIIILTDDDGNIRKCNRSFIEFTGIPYLNVIGKEWEKVLREAGFESNAFFGESIELLHQPSHKWYRLKSYPFNDIVLSFSGNVITIQDITELKQISEEIDVKNKELKKAYLELKASQLKILQQEKMASIGQLAAGVAHEINNPMGFISSNLGTLRKYMDKLTEFINMQSEIIKAFNSPEYSEMLKERRKALKLDYIIEDIKDLVGESLDGAERVKKIVQDLKSFSRVDEADYKYADINECIESTLNIAWNELKYKAKVKKEYGVLPQTKCYPQQLNQVVMNLLLNAAQAIEKQGEIYIKTWGDNGSIMISVSDTGRGIPPENRDKIFEPFFTTKEVGKGTGLGLSIVYDIVKKHKGEITVESKINMGTTFTVKIPVVDGK